MLHTQPIRFLFALAAFSVALLLAVPSSAQRGMGDSEGVARQGTEAMFKDLNGVVVTVEEGQCATTTGRATMGAHVILRTRDQKRLNLHLGPVDAVQDLLDRLTPGTQISAGTFWTDNMPSESYVARTVTIGSDVFELRDQALRPLWRIGAGGGARQGMGQGAGQGMGQGRGQGRGQGQQGMGQGRGSGTPAGGAGPCWW